MAAGQPFDYVATVWSFGERATIPAGTTRHLAAHGGANTPLANEVGVVVLHTGTLKNLTWSCTSSTLTGAKNTIAVYINGIATGLVTSWPAATTSGKAVKGDIPVKQGDVLSMRIQTAAGAGSITRPRASVELEVRSTIPWWSNATGMFYNGPGKIGIGTDSPAETLSVQGAIESMSGGFKFPDGSVQTSAAVAPEPGMPPGSVIAYAGALAPAGWLLCNGSVVDRTTFADLFAAIGIAHGEGLGSTTFALPDYQGVFLRGVAVSSVADPDVGARTAQGPGGNVGDAVGSRQGDQTRSHYHRVGEGGADSFTMAPGGATGRLAHFVSDEYNAPATHHFTGGGHLTTLPGALSLGVETRPKNAYVHYLIKT